MYIDGFVLAVPTHNRDSYIALASLAAGVFKEHGALSVVEGWGDDVPEGEITSFPMAVKKAADETVVLSWITWPDKPTRDAGLKSAMADPRLAGAFESMPFDTRRMIFGGFEPIVQQ